MPSQDTAPTSQPLCFPNMPLIQASVPQAATFAASQEAPVALAKMLAEAIATSRTPVPEPAVFLGNPLQYNDWKLSF